jgi:hypothetical protein
VTNKRHERVSLPRFQRYDAPREVVDLARRRTEFLTRLAFDLSPQNLAMCAYLQGIRDASEALERSPTGET